MGKSTLIIFTCSDDGTVNRLEPLLETRYLRINLDQPETWNFDATPNGWSLSSKGTEVKNNDIVHAWWWKAFLDEFEMERFTKAEIEYMTRELYHELVSKGSYVGNDFLHHEYRGKRHYLKAASKYLRVPETLISQQGKWRLVTDDVIVKSLASTAFSSERVLYTTRVDQKRLDFSNPWFIQEWVEAEFDVTVQIVGQEIFPFQRMRASGQTVDWRKEQNYSSNVREWFPSELSQLETEQLRAFVASESLSWGRIDLLRSYSGELVFLELNANGQFGFLDPLNELGLLSTVARHLSSHPESQR
jgi:hypothetical protein